MSEVGAAIIVGAVVAAVFGLVGVLSSAELRTRYQRRFRILIASCGVVIIIGIILVVVGR